MDSIKKVVVFNAPIEKVWKSVATAEGIAAWFMPNDMKPEPGYEFTLNAGPFGNSPCKVTVVEPPHLLGFDWGQEWHILFELKDLGESQTEFTLTHSGWDADKVTEFGETHAVVRERMDHGWGGLVEKLRGTVEA